MLEYAFAAMLLVDYGQTRDIRNHPDRYETNRLLGPHPSDVRIRNYFLTAAVVHPVVTHLLPEQYRP